MTKTKPLYKMIIDDLKEQILSGDFEYNTPITTERGLMEKYNVSRITAMNALVELDKEGIIYRKHGCGSFVTPEGALKIEESRAASEPPVTVQGRNRDVRLIALVLPFDTKHGGMLECLRGINDVVGAKGTYLSIHNSYRDPERESAILHELISQGVDGIICYPFRDNYNAEIYNHCTLSGLPIVLIDRYAEGIPVTHVISDNFGGMKSITEGIIDKGHKKIAFISEDAFGEATPVKNRYLGYIEALHERNIPLNLELVKIRLKDRYKYKCDKEGLNKEEYRYTDYLTEQLDELYRMGTTAIVCENDFVALEVIRIYENILRLPVPDFISVAGFDNIHRITGVGAELTTAEQDFYEIGRRAAEIICSQIEGGDNARIRNVVPIRVIEGKTVKKLN